MSDMLGGKVAVVTGGGRAIGREAAHVLLEHGARGMVAAARGQLALAHQSA